MAECWVGSEILRALARGYNNPAMSDVTVVAPSGEEFYCSKFVLCSTSDVFGKMLSSEMVEGRSGRVTLQEVERETLAEFLQCLHTGTCVVTETNVLPLWELANRFQIDFMRRICDTFAKSMSINDDNCQFLLERSVNYLMADITWQCFRYMINEDVAGRCPWFCDLDFPEISGLAEYATYWMGMIDVHDRTDAILPREAVLTSDDYCKLLRGIGKWLLQRRQKGCMKWLPYLNELVLQRLDLAVYERKDSTKDSPCLSWLFGARDLIKWNKIWFKLVTRFEVKVGWWQNWAVPSTDWYYLIAQGQDEQRNCRPSHQRGGRAQGALYLRKGERLKILIGRAGQRAGGGCCVIRVPTRGHKPYLVMVGGGGGFTSPAERCQKTCEDGEDGDDSKLSEGCALFLYESNDLAWLNGSTTCCDGGAFGGGGYCRGNEGRGGSCYISPAAAIGNVVIPSPSAHTYVEILRM
ncbi:hypothetical protein BSKO_12352 [Bryopsis sp. KO-2023]|nr:hypothetical protein BSKO_12352 [Bryopsis sp. KO-2023]